MTKVQNNVSSRIRRFQAVDFINRTRRNRRNAKNLTSYSVDLNCVNQSFIERIFNGFTKQTVRIGKQNVTLQLTNKEILVINKGEKSLTTYAKNFCLD